MHRSSPRINVSLPVRLSSWPGYPELTMTQLGMNGAFIEAVAREQGEDLAVNETVTLRYQLNGKETLMHQATCVRRAVGGYGLGFPDLDPAQARKLWPFLAARITRSSRCEYCHQKMATGVTSCPACGWNLDFKSPAYFEYFQKRNLLLRVGSMIEGMDQERLGRTYEYIARIASEEEPAGEENDEEFVGTCPSMREVFGQIRKVAATEISVVILGESGTGKEMTAQSIHQKSARREGPFVAINCGAIPENLLESELFGHEKGAFTGAHATTTGKLECADGGTIFLDEIGEMPLPLQVKLLRFLQERTIEKVGSIVSRKVDVRVIAATNSDLPLLIEQGKFRKDLYYRLEEFVIHLPPVRERGDDRIILARFFLKRFDKEKGSAKFFTGEAVDAIVDYEWPGNVREIINKVKRAIVMRNGNAITPADLGLDLPGPTTRGGCAGRRRWPGSRRR